MVKGIGKSHKELISNYFKESYALNDTEKICFFPTGKVNLFEKKFPNFLSSGPYWITFITMMVISTLFGFKRIITSTSITPDLFMDIIDRHKVALIICPPYHGIRMMQSENYRPMKSVKLVFVGGSTLKENILLKMKEMFPNGNIYPLYASTEVGVGVVCKGIKGDSSGVPAPNTSMRVIYQQKKINCIN